MAAGETGGAFLADVSNGSTMVGAPFFTSGGTAFLTAGGATTGGGAAFLTAGGAGGAALGGATLGGSCLGGSCWAARSPRRSAAPRSASPWALPRLGLLDLLLGRLLLARLVDRRDGRLGRLGRLLSLSTLFSTFFSTLSASLSSAARLVPPADAAVCCVADELLGLSSASFQTRSISRRRRRTPGDRDHRRSSRAAGGDDQAALDRGEVRRRHRQPGGGGRAAAIALAALASAMRTRSSASGRRSCRIVVGRRWTAAIAWRPRAGRDGLPALLPTAASTPFRSSAVRMPRLRLLELRLEVRHGGVVAPRLPRRDEDIATAARASASASLPCRPSSWRRSDGSRASLSRICGSAFFQRCGVLLASAGSSSFAF